MPNSLYNFPNPFHGLNEGLQSIGPGLMQAQQLKGMQQQQLYQGLLNQKAQMDVQEAQKEQQNKEGLLSAMQQPSDKSSWGRQADYWMTKGETNKALQAMQIGKAEEELNANPAALKYAKMITEIRKADKSGKLLKMMWSSIQTQFPKETMGTSIDELVSYGQQGVTARRIPNSNFIAFYNENGERIEIKEDKPNKLSLEEQQNKLLTPEERKEAALIKAGLKTGATDTEKIETSYRLSLNDARRAAKEQMKWTKNQLAMFQMITSENIDSVMTGIQQSMTAEQKKEFDNLVSDNMKLYGEDIYNLYNQRQPKPPPPLYRGSPFISPDRVIKESQKQRKPLSAFER